MTWRGTVKNGVVVPNDQTTLPEGAEVIITDVAVAAAAPRRSLVQGLKQFVGVAHEGPPDGSRNVDHYLYGAPRR